MKTWLATLAVALLASAAPAGAADCPAALDFYQRPLLGDKPVHLCEEFGGRVVLIVNTASKCGFTPQYDGLEEIYARYRDRGLVVAGFPSNDFGGQESGVQRGFVLRAYKIPIITCYNVYIIEYPDILDFPIVKISSAIVVQIMYTCVVMATNS